MQGELSLKIIQVVEAFGGGVYSFLTDLCNDICDNHDVIIVYSKRNITPENFKKDFDPRIKFIELDMSLKKSVKAINSLKHIISKENPEVIHFHSSKAGYVGRIAAKLINYKGKVFYNPHGLAYLRLDLPKWLRTVFFIIEKFLSKIEGKIIAVSDSEKKQIEVFSNNVISINNGIDIEKIQKEINREDFGENNESKELVVGTIGRIEFQKNPSLFNDIAKALPNLRFIWIGDGSLSDQLTSKNIEITGWLSRNEVIKEISKIDIYIQTSLWEGLPIAVLESMLMKKPILVNNAVGNIDLVKNEKNGYVFTNTNEAIYYLNKFKENKELISTFGIESREIIVNEFNLETTINQYKKEYGI